MFVHNIFTAYPGSALHDDDYVCIFSWSVKSRDYL